MDSPPFIFQCLLLSLLIIPNFVSSGRNQIPRLRTILHEPESIPTPISKDFETFFYAQTLDHFNYNPQSYSTFKQRYVINFKHWGGANCSAPIFAYLGAEAELDYDLDDIGFLSENAHRFKALQVYIEHRYYGKSIPFGSMEEVMKNESARGYFNSAQAIADYAEVLVYLKKKLSAKNSPIIVIGASYGGMLASWFRLKYPHIAIGALASSAPILYFDDITPQNGYYSLVTKDFKEASETCYETIQKSWSEIDKEASKPNGLSILTKRFKICGYLNDSSELKNYLETIYSRAAQYNSPPSYPVTVVCGGIDGAPAGTDLLGRIFAGLVAYRGNRKCYATKESPSQTSMGWAWQDIKLVLNKFASNIIFSNGLRDPYSSAGVLENISESVVAVHTVNGSHCLDIVPANPSDPEWLVDQRKVEVDIIQGWINNYYAQLLAHS